jgi:hypothetical protein
MMRRFYEDISRVGQRQQMAAPEFCYEIRHDVIIGAGHQLERNPFLVQCLLQLLGGLADLRACIVIQSRQDMRRTGNDRHTVGHGSFGHLD